MKIIWQIYQSISTYFYLLGLRDAIEIIFFSLLFYYLACWLKKDKAKNLLGYFYAYLLVVFLAYMMQLSTISYFLFLFAPATIMLFMFLHQETLQYNIVAFGKSTHAARSNNNQWIETLLRIGLLMINNNKELYCLIEHTDPMQKCIATPYSIKAELQTGLLKILTASDLFEQHKMIWVNTQGQLLGINATWLTNKYTLWQSKSSQTVDQIWQDYALLYTSKTDGLALHANPGTQNFTLIVQGKVFAHIKADQAKKIIKTYTRSRSEQEKRTKKGDIYGPQAKKDSLQQHTT